MDEPLKGIASMNSRVSDLIWLIDTFKARGAKSEPAKRIMYDAELALLKHEQLMEMKRIRERAAQSKLMQQVSSIRMRAAAMRGEESG